MQPLIQLQSLFAKEAPKEVTNALELKIPQLVTEIDDYFEELRSLSKIGFSFSSQENKFSYTQDVISLSTAAYAIVNGVLMLTLPGNGLMKLSLLMGLTGVGLYKYLSKENGIYKERLEAIKTKTNTLKTLLQNDTFKISLIVNIEKDFNTLEEKFQFKPETLTMVKKKRNEIINELKNLLVEENLNGLTRLLDLLRNIKEIEEQTQKLLKLDRLNEEVNKRLNNHVSESPEENEVTEKIKSLL